MTLPALTPVRFLVQLRLLVLRCLCLAMDTGSIDFVFGIKSVCGFHTTKIKKIFEIF